MQPMNLLFIMSDEHQRNVTGCYGHPIVQTPNLDQLAARGARFTHAYTNCPICVPCRASLATGRYVHQIGHWDNAFPYCGAVPAWGHRLQAQGLRADSIGKLHYRRAENDDGFARKHDTMYVAEGIGELISCIRLRAIVDPLAVDVHAKADQQAKLDAFGGEEAVLQRGLSNSAIPGEAPVFQRMVR